MRWLILGAGGLVGSAVREALAARDVTSTFRVRVPQGGLPLDITDADRTSALIHDVGPTVLVLAAADASVEKCELDPVGTRRVNVDAARVVADAAAEVGALLVVFSSEYVFPGTAGVYHEKDRRSPVNEYGRQKVDLEDLALGVGGLVCRTSGVYGLHPDRKNFVCQLVDRLRSNRVFEVASDQLITPTSADSLAKALVRLSEAGQRGVFHVAGPEVLNRLEFALMVAKAYNLDPSLVRSLPTSSLGLVAARPLQCGLAMNKLVAAGYDLTRAEVALAAMAAADASPP